MGYDRGDSFPFDFEPNRNPLGLKTEEKLSPRSYPIQCERKWKHSFLSLLDDLVSSMAKTGLALMPFFSYANM